MPVHCVDVRKSRHVTFYCRKNVFIVANKTMFYFWFFWPAANLNNGQIIFWLGKNCMQEIQLIFIEYFDIMNDELTNGPVQCIRRATASQETENNWFGWALHAPLFLLCTTARCVFLIYFLKVVGKLNLANVLCIFVTCKKNTRNWLTILY